MAAPIDKRFFSEHFQQKGFSDEVHNSITLDVKNGQKHKKAPVSLRARRKGRELVSFRGSTLIDRNSVLFINWVTASTVFTYTLNGFDKAPLECCSPVRSAEKISATSFPLLSVPLYLLLSRSSAMCSCNILYLNNVFIESQWLF